MSLPSSQPVAQPAPPMPVAWSALLFALLAHTGWGAYPVLARFLQTSSALPSMSILALGNLICIPILWFAARGKLQFGALRSPIVWAFAATVVVRAITNLLSARFTLAIYVQLINLLTPFIVAIMSWAFFRERLPRGTLPALLVSLLGALMMTLGGNMSAIERVLTSSDWLGIGLAFASSCSLAIYMLLVPRTMKAALPGETVFMVQLVALTLTSALISFVIGEDWARYTTLGWLDWAVFGAFVLFVLLGANLGQIMALRQLGAPLVSSIMPWRLISALLLAALLLGEQLSHPTQALGAVIVFCTLSWYLHQQRRNR